MIALIRFATLYKITSISTLNNYCLIWQRKKYGKNKLATRFFSSSICLTFAILTNYQKTGHGS